jgi:hypothetical protein
MPASDKLGRRWRQAEGFAAGASWLQVALDGHSVEDSASDFQIVGLIPGEVTATNPTNDY